MVFLLVGSTYFIYGSDLFGYGTGLFCIGAALYFIRRELRWVSVGQDQVVVRGLLYRREYTIDDDVAWDVMPVDSGLPLYRIDVVSGSEVLVRLESHRYSSEAQAVAVAEALLPRAPRRKKAA